MPESQNQFQNMMDSQFTQNFQNQDLYSLLISENATFAAFSRPYLGRWVSDFTSYFHHPLALLSHKYNTKSRGKRQE